MKYSISQFWIIFIICPLALFAKESTVDEKNQVIEKTEKKDSPADDKEKHKQENGQKTKNEEENQPNVAGGKQTQKGAEEAEKTVKVGNLAFPPSQQPSPLVSFGQNIINRKQAQAQLVVNEFRGENQYFVNINPAIIYAFTDSLSLFLVAPFAARYRQNNHHSSGPEDSIIQLEYAFYTKAYRTFYDQATIVANVTIPTGSAKKNPPTGIGANSFFIGGTYSRMEINWFYFVSAGGVMTTSSHRTQYGDQVLYQFGFGRRITNTKEWLFDWMVEFDGTYSWKDRINGKINPNSGGNVIYITPSLWISSNESLFLQFGMGFPVEQRLFGHQEKIDYALFFNSGWLF